VHPVVAQSQQMSQQSRRSFAGRLLLVVAFAILLVAISAAPAHAITRSQVLARAQTWVDAQVPYSQSASYPDTATGYRTDCSGYVSMAWKLTYSSGSPASYTTSNLGTVSHQLGSAGELQPGDVMLKAGTHVRLFGWWTDGSHTQYVSFEESHSGTNASRYVHSITADLGYGYLPFRYNKIEDEPPSANVLQNWSFEVWSSAKPDSWSYSTDAGGTFWQQTNEHTHSGWSALSVTNPTADPARYSQVQQTAAAQAKRSYTLAAWVISDRNPDGVQMRLQFFDAAGASLTDTFTTGARWSVNSGTMTQMFLPSVAPSGTVKATATLRLTGGSWVGVGGGTGGSAVFDDVWLVAATPVPVYRFFNLRTGTHFYTADPTERDSILRNMAATYRLDGPAWTVNTASPCNSVPLWRFYNVRTGTHFYTASDAEKNAVLTTMGSTYKLDGPAYNVSLSPVNADPVFRFYNPRTGTHFYTASIAERDTVIATLSSTLHYEGPAYFLAR
jgi:hypothetical protein